MNRSYCDECGTDRSVSRYFVSISKTRCGNSEFMAVADLCPKCFDELLQPVISRLWKYGENGDE